MTTYFIYGKHENSIYSTVSGGKSEATQMVRQLRIIHPLEEFHIIPFSGNVEDRIQTEELEYFLKNAIRV